MKLALVPIIFCAACFLLCGSIASSQVTTALSNITVTQSGSVAVTLAFDFAGPVPPHVAAGSATDDIVVTFSNTTRTARVAPTVRGTGLLRSLIIEQNGGDVVAQARCVHAVSYTERVLGQRYIIVLRSAAATSAAPQPSYDGAAANRRPSATETSEMIFLRYADVAEIADMLVAGASLATNDGLSSTGSIFSLPSSTNGSQYQGTSVTNGPTQTGDPSPAQVVNANISINRRLNAIMVSGEPADITRIKAQIRQIDVPGGSVLLDCQVVEITDTAAKDLGIDFASQGVLGTGSFNTRSFQGPTATATFQAQLFGTIAKGGGHVIATPRVQAFNGRPASILSGDALPIVTTTTFPGPPSIIQQSVNYITVGVNLQIRPRISPDGIVTSTILAEVSSVTAFIATPQGSVPQISLRQVTTFASVRNNQSFVIGGLLQDNELRNLAKIPGLGDLPLLGGLFRVRHDSSTKTNLYIVVTPHVVSLPNVEPPAGG